MAEDIEGDHKEGLQLCPEDLRRVSTVRWRSAAADGEQDHRMDLQVVVYKLRFVINNSTLEFLITKRSLCLQVGHSQTVR